MGEFSLNQFKLNLKISSLLVLATFQEFCACVWLMAAVLDSADRTWPPLQQILLIIDNSPERMNHPPTHAFILFLI